MLRSNLGRTLSTRVFLSALKFTQIVAAINTVRRGRPPLSSPTAATDYVHVARSRRSPYTNLNSKCILVHVISTSTSSQTIYRRASSGIWREHVPTSRNRHVVSFWVPWFLQHCLNWYHRSSFRSLAQQSTGLLICSSAAQVYVCLYRFVSCIFDCLRWHWWAWLHYQLSASDPTSCRKAPRWHHTASTSNSRHRPIFSP
jgi:hypothetical protein